MPGRTIHGRHVWTLLASGFVLFIAGCAQEPGGPLCFSTRGKILYDSQPLAEALVVFHPLASEPEGNNHQRPIAVTEADGTFQLSTLGTRDGAPEGDYVITVELREVRMDGDTPVRDGKNLLPPRYQDPAQSSLKYHVIEGENQIPTLELLSR